MKRKVAILLAAVMTTAMLPMNVMAKSENGINKKATVKDDDPITGVYLKITPKDEVETGDSIIVTIENGDFQEYFERAEDEEKRNVPEEEREYPYEEYLSPINNTYDDLVLEYTPTSLKTLLNSNMGVNSNEIPYSIEINSKREIQVSLFPIPSEAADQTDVISAGKPYYNIPIQAVADGTGDVKITIDDNGSSITGGSTYTIATSSNSSGSTTTTVADIETFQDFGELEDITIKENVMDTFEAGKTVKMRLSGGFVINENKSKVVVSPGSNASWDDKADEALQKSIKIEEDEITFTMPIGGTKKASAIKVSGIVVEADDEDKNWGDVSITVSGAGLTKETVKVATRADYGFKMTTTEDPTTIISGRTYVDQDDTDLDEDDFVTAEVKFEETIKDTWLTSRKLEFSVPEGVKIVDFEFDDTEYISEGFLNSSQITNEGQTLRIDKAENASDVDSNDCSEFTMKLYVSIDADYTGEIPLSVAGAGLAADTLEDVVIANAVAPISIESTSTKVNMGYQAMNTGDITITETQEGALLDDETVVVAMDSLYGSDELGFADDNIEFSIDGEMEIKNFKVTKGEIKFTVDKNSYSEPSSITISNVKVGTTRSVPYGSYDFTVGGSAVINNYDEEKADAADYPAKPIGEAGKDKSEIGIAYFDTTETYSFADYLVVVTETGTLDGVVEVTIGEKTILMDGESVDMDVAAYIQPTSNSTMVPLRFVSLAIGVDSANASNADESSKIMWDADTKTATILYAAGNGQKIIQFQAGSAIMTVDGTPITMENGVVAEITDSRMFVPFRALGQALGVSVSWDADTRTAIYNAK